VYLATASLAGDFYGDVNIHGNVHLTGMTFLVGNPFDSAGGAIEQASVQSQDALTICSGTVVTDDGGGAVVAVPAWFDVLNKDFRYQLTVMGQFAQAIVSEEIHDHRFGVRTNVPHVKVSWQVTGVRNDAYAHEHPLVVAPPKEPAPIAPPR